MGNHGAVSAGDRPRALLCWPFQHGARLSSLVLAFPAWCSGWVDLVRSLRLQIRSERRLLVFAPSVGVGESLRQLAALAARRACSVRRRTARESERRRRKNVENGVDWTVPVTSEECMPAYTHFVFGHTESGHCRDCSPGVTGFYLTQFLPPIYSALAPSTFEPASTLPRWSLPNRPRTLHHGELGGRA